MAKSESSTKSKAFPVKFVLIFVFGFVLGVLIQFMFIQPMLDNAPSFKSSLADCETSKEICDKEVKSYFECFQKHSINPNTDCS